MNARKSAYFWGVFSLISSVLPFLFIQKNGGVDLSLPLMPNHGDMDFVLVWIKGVARGEFVPFVSNSLPRMGAPFQPLNLSEGFPLTEQLQMLVIKLFTFFSNDPMTVWNLYFLSGYVLTAAAFFISALTIGIHPAISFGLSLAFTYLPFHFLRYEHLFLSQYWVLAPAAAILIHVLRHDLPLPRRKLLSLGGAIFFVTLWHSYYGFFFAGVLCLAWIFRAIRRKSRLFVAPLLLALLAFTNAIAVSVTHHVVAVRRSVDRPPPFKRDPSDALMYSLRPGAILLPAEGHRFAPFRELRDYSLRGRGRVEGLTESIGTLGFLGFILGLGVAFRRWRKSASALPYQVEAASVQFFALLFSIRPGVASVIAYTLSASFRCGNRISPMLAAAALFGFGLVTSGWMKRKNFNPVIASLIGIAIGLFSIWDQALPIANVEHYQAEIASTRQFVREIEARVGAGAVLQLPVVLFPEQGPIHGMSDYAHAAGPLYSEQTRWSYGTWRETRAMAQIQALGASPEHFESLRAAGYTGIWIDRKGYPDGATGLVSLIKKHHPNVPEIQSADGRRIFFRL